MLEDLVNLRLGTVRFILCVADLDKPQQSVANDWGRMNRFISRIGGYGLRGNLNAILQFTLVDRNFLTPKKIELSRLDIIHTKTATKEAAPTSISRSFDLYKTREFPVRKCSSLAGPTIFTFIGLVRLIRHCRRLHTVGMSFCAYEVDINSEPFSTTIPNDGITKLFVGMSPIIDPIAAACHNCIPKWASSTGLMIASPYPRHLNIRRRDELRVEPYEHLSSFSRLRSHLPRARSPLIIRYEGFDYYQRNGTAVSFSALGAPVLDSPVGSNVQARRKELPNHQFMFVFAMNLINSWALSADR
ncbi:hypothetical protein EDB19DRAFT_1822257 [Suillus lakei]|nr:hypothetical protein EDB19DRAFT_1822257 [Suillus lakei]